MASEYFHHLPEWEVIVCKECRHVVWPDQCMAHLQGRQHSISRKDAQPIVDEVQSWPGVQPFSSLFQPPTSVPQPIPELVLYADGLQCRLDPSKCQYICRGEKVIREHWRTQHNGWSIQTKSGRASAVQASVNQQRFNQAVRSVQCQRFSPKGAHSSYFIITQAEDARVDQARQEGNAGIWERMWARATRHFDEIQSHEAEVIEEGEKDEVNPWLKRTGWVSYLKGSPREELLRSIQDPAEVPVDEAADEQEQIHHRIDQAVWDAVGQMAATCQDTVSQSGVMIRMQAVRTEKDQVKYQPLQSYADAKDIQIRGRPWQQMVMFFTRTQRPHPWQSPSYRFTHHQAAAFRRLIEEAEQTSPSHDVPGDDDDDDDDDDDAPEMTPVQRAALDFCIELLNQKVRQNEYECALVGASAVLGVSPGKGWRDPGTYPPILSSIIKVAHFMVVRKAIDRAREEEREEEDDHEFSRCERAYEMDDSGYESNGSSPRRPTRPNKSGLERVQEMTDAFMVRRTNSPADWLLDLRTYGLKIHYNTTADGHVSWKDRQVLCYKHLSFSMDQFRGMVDELQKSTREALFQKVIGVHSREQMPVIPWATLHDDPSNGSVGWNFIEDKRNQFPVDGQQWLFQQIQANPDTRDRFIEPGSESGIRKGEVVDWTRQVDAFRAKLLVLMHITGGAPARGPEILSVRHRNTINGGHRNLFIEDGLVVFVTRYSKQFMITGDVKIIHRYLPREVGELVVYYLWLVLPFIQRVEAMVWQQTEVSSYLWPRSVEGQKWTTQRMTRAMKQASAATIGQEITTQAYREIAIAISREWVRGAHQFEVDEGDNNPEWEAANAMNHAADEQATHSPHIAGTIYARNSTEQSGVNADTRRRFRLVSADWHRFLGCPSTHAGDRKVDLKRKRLPFESYADDEQVARRKRLRTMDSAAELKRMMTKDVAFRSRQSEAIQAIQAGQSPVVAVMPTGSGKSVLFMLPAWVEPGGLTVVVIPLNALRADMMHRCRALGIACTVWDGRTQADSASIVMVTPEKAVDPRDDAFATFLQRMKQARRLDRIVVDECHVILNDRVDFRKNLQRIGHLAHAETQMVLLTATLPPTEEDQLFKRMYWHRDEVTLVRASTIRKNITYQVSPPVRNRAEHDARLTAAVEAAFANPARPESKVLVMCRTVVEVKRIVAAGWFMCEGFYAPLDASIKAELLQQFREGEFRVVVASPAFGAGIDISGIDDVIHSDEPENMLDFGQSSGRGGRDGYPTRSIIIRGGRQSDDPLIQAYMDPQRTQCRRIDLDGYLDGTIDRQECGPDEAPCDCCMRQRTSEDPSDEPVKDEPISSPSHSDRERQMEEQRQIERRRIHERQREQRRIEDERIRKEQAEHRAIEVQDSERCGPQVRRQDAVIDQHRTRAVVQAAFDRWKRVCAICRSRGRDHRHIMRECADETTQTAERQRVGAQGRGGIRYAEKGGICFKCGVSKQICERWVDEFEQADQGACQYWGIGLGVIYGIRHGYPRVWQRWTHQIQQHGHQVNTEATLVRFLGRLVDGDSDGMCEMVKAFVWLTRAVENEETRG